MRPRWEQFHRGLLQGRLDEYEQSVRDAADRDRATYLMLYLGISALSILGAILKVLDKLGPPSAAPVLRTR